MNTTTNLRERTDHQPPPPTTGSGDAGGGGLDALAQEGAAFLAAGHDIIAAALSGDSQAFLEANRQRGGE
jgi:hypothetical protein